MAGPEGYGHEVAGYVVEYGRGGFDEPTGDGADLGGRLRHGERGEEGSQVGKRQRLVGEQVRGQEGLGVPAGVAVMRVGRGLALFRILVGQGEVRSDRLAVSGSRIVVRSRSEEGGLIGVDIGPAEDHALHRLVAVGGRTRGHCQLG